MMRAQGVGQDVWKENLRTGTGATGGHFSQPPALTQEEAASLPHSLLLVPHLRAPLHWVPSLISSLSPGWPNLWLGKNACGLSLPADRVLFH